MEPPPKRHRIRRDEDENMNVNDDVIYIDTATKKLMANRDTVRLLFDMFPEETAHMFKLTCKQALVTIRELTKTVQLQLPYKKSNTLTDRSASLAPMKSLETVEIVLNRRENSAHKIPPLPPLLFKHAKRIHIDASRAYPYYALPLFRIPVTRFVGSLACLLHYLSVKSRRLCADDIEHLELKMHEFIIRESHIALMHFPKLKTLIVRAFTEHQVIRITQLFKVTTLAIEQPLLEKMMTTASTPSGDVFNLSRVIRLPQLNMPDDQVVDLTRIGNVNVECGWDFVEFVKYAMSFQDPRHFNFLVTRCTIRFTGAVGGGRQPIRGMDIMKKMMACYDASRDMRNWCVVCANVLMRVHPIVLSTRFYDETVIMAQRIMEGMPAIADALDTENAIVLLEVLAVVCKDRDDALIPTILKWNNYYNARIEIDNAMGKKRDKPFAAFDVRACVDKYCKNVTRQ